MILNIKQTQFGAEPEFEIEDTATGETLAKCTSLNPISEFILVLRSCKMIRISVLSDDFAFKAWQ